MEPDYKEILKRRREDLVRELKEEKQTLLDKISQVDEALESLDRIEDRSAISEEEGFLVDLKTVNQFFADHWILGGLDEMREKGSCLDCGHEVSSQGEGHIVIYCSNCRRHYYMGAS